MDKFKEIFVGDYETITHTITNQDIDNFINLTGDDNRLHHDKSFAKKTHLKKPVAHGMLSASFISTIIGTKLPGDGALWYSQTIEFSHPVRVGDTITIKAEVTKKIERLRHLEIKIEILNQHNQMVISGLSKVKVLESKEENKSNNKNKPCKCALVVGATGGIGAAVCMQLARDGFIGYYSNDKKAESLKVAIEKIGRKASIIKGNITNFESCEQIVSSALRYFDDISTFVNCTTPPVANIPFQEVEWSNFENHLDMNVKSNFHLLKLLLPNFLKNQYANFITISTQYTDDPQPKLTGYISAKAAMEGFMRSLVTELSPLGVRFNMVSAGMVNTDLIADIPEKAKLITEAKTPLKRLGSPEDVANAISYLASDKSDFLTGETIRVNGGQLMV